MDDVMQIAQERAERPKTAPIGSGFESERQRSKNALVRQIDSLDGRNVRMIAAAGATPEEDRILRVAAYCRVSTDDIDQALSIRLQIPSSSPSATATSPTTAAATRAGSIPERRKR